MFARLNGWLAWRKRKAHARAAAKGDVVRASIIETCLLADERGLEVLTPPQRRVVQVWAARGVIGNGGFRAYFEGDWRMSEVAGAFRELGFSDAAVACERALNAFPGAVPPPDPARRSELVRAADWRAFADDEDAIFEVGWDALQRALAGYMRRFPGDFPPVAR